MAGPAVIFREIHRLRLYLANLQEQLNRFPIQRKVRQAKVDKLEQALKAEQEGIKQLKVKISENEKTLKAKSASIERWQEQQSSAASKKQHDALVVEIAHARDVCKRLEEDTLNQMAECEDRVLRLPETETALQGARTTLHAWETETAARQADLKAQMTKAQEDLKAVEQTIPEKHREQYRRTVASMKHDGFAAVKDQGCSACHVRLIDSMQRELEAEDFAVCPSCGRIVYLPETVKRPMEEVED